MQRSQVIDDNSRGIPLIRFPLFEPYGKIMEAVYTTRRGGVSGGCFASLNLSFDQGDEAQNVCENYRLAAQALGAGIGQLVFTDQKHTANIRAVTEEDAGKGMTRARDYRAVDGLVTDVPGLVLVTLHADCTPVYIFDPVIKAIGLVHAGWKGTVAEITAKAIGLMSELYHSRAEDLLVAVGPAACGTCYEIGAEVKREFDGMSIDVSEYIAYDRDKDKYFPDIPLINGALAVAQGVHPENVMIADACTMEEPDRFFSHRIHHSERGSQAAFMFLRTDI